MSDPTFTEEEAKAFLREALIVTIVTVAACCLCVGVTAGFAAMHKAQEPLDSYHKVRRRRRQYLQCICTEI